MSLVERGAREVHYSLYRSVRSVLESLYDGADKMDAESVAEWEDHLRSLDALYALGRPGPRRPA